MAMAMLFVQSSSSGCVSARTERGTLSVSVSLAGSMENDDERCFALAVSVVSAEEFDGGLMQG